MIPIRNSVQSSARLRNSNSPSGGILAKAFAFEMSISTCAEYDIHSVDPGDFLLGFDNPLCSLVALPGSFS